MAMSQGERIARLQEQSNQYVSRRQTKDCSLQTYIVQAKASGVVQPRNRTPTTYAIENKVVAQGSQVPLTRDTAIGKNVYSAEGAPLGCCATVVASGTETFAGTQAVTLAAQKCAVCSDPDYSLANGYATKLNTVCCPLPNLVNTAKTTQAEQCASCKKFYFPTVKSDCRFCTPYPSSQLYPPPPIDWELRRYGDSGTVPTSGPCGAIPTISDFGITGLAYGQGPWIVAWNQTGTQQVGVQVLDPNGNIFAASITINSLSQITIADFTNPGGRGATYSVVVFLTNDCGSISQTGSFYVRG